MIKQLGASALLAVALTACGGGGGYGGGMYGGPPGPTAPPASSPLSTMTLNGGPGFVNSANRTVYMFDADTTANASTCSGGCAAVWPPVTVAAGATLPPPWTSFQRGDGTTQLAYKGRALYTYVVDQNPGDTKGDGINSFNNVWHIARP